MSEHCGCKEYVCGERVYGVDSHACLYPDALEAIRRLRVLLSQTHLLLERLGQQYPGGPSKLEDQVQAILTETEKFV